MPGKNYTAITDVGLQRKNNEDAILSNPKNGLWLVADGMGGHAAGEVASEITGVSIEQAVKQGKSLKEAIELAHKAVITAAEDGNGRAGMGSTVVALKSRGNHYEIAWVGDSRAYLCRKTDNQLQLHQLTTDHSYVQMLFQSGLINAEEMANHPEKNIITQCLGSTELDEVKVDIIERKWQEGDWILLCSDGLSDVVTNQEISAILENNEDIEKAGQALVEAALTNGGRDNISVILVGPPSGIKVSVQAKLDSISGRWKNAAED